MIGGTIGKILRVDLSSRKISTENLNEEYFKKFGGQIGLGVRMLYDEVPPGVKGLDPENRLIFLTGPFTGTRVQSSSNYEVITRNPMSESNPFAIANSHGFWGPRLKAAGFDGIIVQGKSDRPVYLWVHDGECEIRDASRLWGKLDCFETEDAVRAELGQEKASVACIGPAGEHIVASSMVENEKGHVAAKGNPGMVMGSKKLKAIAVAGTGKFSIADSEQFAEVAKTWRDESFTSGIGAAVNAFGTGGFIPTIHELGDLPTKNFTTGVCPGFETLTGMYIRQNYEMKRNPCFGCSLAHVHQMKITKGPYTGFECEEPEYEDLSNLGSNIGIVDAGTVGWLTDYVDRLGLEGNWAGAAVGWAMEAFEKGILTKGMLDGMELKWGDEKAAAELLRKIAYREGIGDTLAMGLKEGALRIGGERAAAFAVHIKGEANHAHDSRSMYGQFVGLLVSGGGPRWEVMGADLLPDAEIGFPQPPDRFGTSGRANELRLTQFKKLFLDTLGTCYFGTVSLGTSAKAYKALTGISMDKDEAMKVGERIANVQRAFNTRHGFRPKDDLNVSPRLLEAPPDGGSKGKSIAPYLERMVKEYYQAMDWDWETGKPSPGKLEELGLDDIAKDLWG